MTEKLKAGDVVRLKSDGPNMTVNAVNEFGQVHCVWFVGVQQHEGRFNDDALQLAPPEDKTPVQMTRTKTRLMR